jgi:glucokinase
MNYLGIDIGGSKTHIAVFDSSGKIISQKKFETNKNYERFISDVEKNVASLSTNTNIACAAAVPGLLSRDTGVVHALGNLDWKNKHIRDDISKVIGNIPVVIENDTRVGGVAEAKELSSQYDHILYLTISTGIGGALLRNGDVVKDLEDSEMGKIPLLYEGKMQHWEDFAGGRDIVRRYGKRASDIDTPEQWQEIGERIAYGVAICCSILQPQAVIFGGGVGQSADKFKNYIKDYLLQHLHPVARQPDAFLGPKFGENSVIYGCFILLKQQGLIK